MTLRTGHITQETRGARDTEKNLQDITKEITKKRNEIKKLIYLLNTIIPSHNIKETSYPTKWDYLKRMSKEALDKLQKAKPPFVRPTRYRARSVHASGGERITQQHMKDDCDINIIIKRHAETGNISHLNPKSPLYIDCTGVKDLQSAIHLVEEAEDNFSSLPSAVRKACDNDSVKFIDMLHTDEGTQILGDAGLEYAAEPSTAPDTGTVVPTQKPETIPAEKITTPSGENATRENTPMPQGGK